MVDSFYHYQFDLLRYGESGASFYFLLLVLMLRIR